MPRVERKFLAFLYVVRLDLSGSVDSQYSVGVNVDRQISHPFVALFVFTLPQSEDVGDAEPRKSTIRRHEGDSPRSSSSQ